MSTGLKAGDLAPAFKLPASDGTQVSLAALKGKVVVLYFYPKDDTPGCTVEACEFGASHKDFAGEGAVVLGVSPDGLEAHAKFISKFKLPFILLADTDHAVAEAYGVWAEKSMYGKTFMGIVRSTFLIDKAGKLARVWGKVKAEGHAAEVLAALKEI